MIHIISCGIARLNKIVYNCKKIEYYQPHRFIFAIDFNGCKFLIYLFSCKINCLLLSYNYLLVIFKRPGPRGPLWARLGPMGFSPVEAEEAQARPKPVKGRAGPRASFQAWPSPVGWPESWAFRPAKKPAHRPVQKPT